MHECIYTLLQRAARHTIYIYLGVLLWNYMVGAKSKTELTGTTSEGVMMMAMQITLIVYSFPAPNSFI
jgi:hypothetical protein